MYDQYQEIVKAFKLEQLANVRSNVERLIKWEPPPDSNALNVDGTSRGNPGLAGREGVF